MSKSALPFRAIHSIEISVHEAASWVGYFANGFGFQLVAVDSGPTIERTGTRRHLLACGETRFIVQEPVHAGSAVRRFLEKHPEGISRVNLLVDSVSKIEESLLERHATLTDFAQSEDIGAWLPQKNNGGRRGDWKHVSIATPLGDVEFGFIESPDPSCTSMPGMQPTRVFDPTHNPLGITGIDHLVSNVRTLMPVLAFYEHVLGLRKSWDVRFHAEEIRPGVGTGLTSIVMSHEQSALKIATNEPLRPRFEQSQVQLMVDTNRGPGIHQIALGVSNMVHAVDSARAAGIQFLTTPPTYYTALPARLRAQRIADVTESVEWLAGAGVLVDGDRNGHLLQAFCQDQANQFGRLNAGPILFELIQRRGCLGFGEGNFRALFESTQRA